MNNMSMKGSITTNFVSLNDHSVHRNNIERLWKNLGSTFPSNLKIDALKSYIKNYMVNRVFYVRNSMEHFCVIINTV